QRPLWGGTSNRAYLLVKFKYCESTSHSSVWIRTMYPLRSTYHTVTGVVELSIQVRRSCEYGSGVRYSIQRSVRGFNRRKRPPCSAPAQMSPFLSGIAS